MAAPLWPMHGASLGTSLRTCDAVGACLAVPPFRWVDEAIARGNTLRRPSCVHRIGDPFGWFASERAAGSQIVGVELADEPVLGMPPVPLWYRGSNHYGRLIERVFQMSGADWAMTQLTANGQPALAAYAPRPGGGSVLTRYGKAVR